MVKVYKFIFGIGILSCVACLTEDNPKYIDDVGLDIEAGSLDVRHLDSRITNNTDEDLSEFCFGLDEQSCLDSPCTVIRGRKYDAQKECNLKEGFALCTGVPRCNNSLIFHHVDPTGTCWEFNGCTPKEWTARELGDKCGSIEKECD